jgi:hypothetical protein
MHVLVRVAPAVYADQLFALKRPDGLSARTVRPACSTRSRGPDAADASLRHLHRPARTVVPNAEAVRADEAALIPISAPFQALRIRFGWLMGMGSLRMSPARPAADRKVLYVSEIPDSLDRYCRHDPDMPELRHDHHAGRAESCWCVPCWLWPAAWRPGVRREAPTPRGCPRSASHRPVTCLARRGPATGPACFKAAQEGSPKAQAAGCLRIGPAIWPRIG